VSVTGEWRIKKVLRDRISTVQTVFLVLGFVGIMLCAFGLALTVKWYAQLPSRDALRRMASMRNPEEFAFLSGDECWAHWVLSDDTWRAWANQRFNESAKKAKSPWFWLIVPVAALGAWLSALNMIAVGLSLAIGCAAVFAVRSWPAMRYRKMLDQPHELFIGSKGIYFRARFRLWNSALMTLRCASIWTGPPPEPAEPLTTLDLRSTHKPIETKPRRPELMVVMERRIYYGQYLNYDDIRVRTMWLPIPVGHEEEALTVTERLNANVYERKSRYAEALHLYRTAAELGDAVAQCKLGFMLVMGLGTTQDLSEAVRWLRKAVDQGHAGARFCLGLMYKEGRGVTQNLAEAVRFLREAAAQGDAAAQSELGSMYENGEGVTQDSVEAYKWMKLASLSRNRAGRSDLANRCRTLAERMSRAEVNEAERRTAEWQPQPVRTVL
jgi:hypothetical protein